MKNLEILSTSRALTVALVVVVTVLAVHVTSVHTADLRADLTADDLYSLSGGTVAILERMQREGVKPIEVTLYFSETAGNTLPKFVKDFVTFEAYLRALLEEYAVASGGKVRVRFVDPVPDTDAAKDAQDFGLEGKPINQHGDLFFFGLVLQAQTGTRDVIEFLWPARQETVEYEISKRLYNLLWPQRKRIAVVSSVDPLSQDTNPYMAQILAAQGRPPGETWISMRLLQEQYDVQSLGDVDHVSPDEYDLVLVVHPKDLGDRTLWALDEWVVSGGRTLVFLDPYTLEDEPPPNPQQPWLAFQHDRSSSLSPLLESWGLHRVDGAVAADFELGLTRMAGGRGPAERVVVDLAIEGARRDETLLTSHPVFQGLTSLRFFLAGALTTVHLPPGVTATPLVTTTVKGNTLEMRPGFPGTAELVFADLNDPGKLRARFTPGDKPVTIAYLLEGRIPSAFPEGTALPAETPRRPPGMPPGFKVQPPEGTEMLRKDPVAEERRAETTLMVFADVDFITDPLAFQRTPVGALATNDNHRVLLNAVDFLLGSRELMQVRSKKSIRRPFLLFDRIEEEADLRTQERERQLREEIAGFEQQLQELQRSIGARNAALLQKQVQDQVDDVNGRIQQANAELYEIRKAKRAALEAEEARVRFATLWLTPALVLTLGLALVVRRRARDRGVRRSGS